MDYKLPESKDFSKPFNQHEIPLYSSVGAWVTGHICYRNLEHVSAREA